MKIPYFWKKNSILSYLLLPFTLFFMLGTLIRKIINFPIYYNNVFVICIGNANAGGSGKTPVAINVALQLSKALPDIKIALLCKGYNSSIKATTLVTSSHSAVEVGDESLLLAKHFPTFISKNYKEALKLISKNGFNMVIVDDGFQNPSIKKDYNILVTNGTFGFGNQKLIPAGPLRQSINDALSKTDALLILEQDIWGVHNLIKNSNYKSLPIFNGTYHSISNHNSSSKYIAFCGIAMPEKFFNSLKQLNLNVIDFCSFPDHFNYKETDFITLLQKAKTLNAEIITTSKDFVKVPAKYRDKIQELEIQVNIENQDQLIKNIKNKYLIHNVFRRKQRTYMTYQKKFVNHILFYLATSSYYLVKLMSYKVASFLGKFLGETLLYKVSSNRRTYSLNSLSLTFPTKSKAELIQILKSSCGTTARSITELIKIKSLYKEKKYYKVHDPYNTIALSKNNSVLFFGAHFSNWEISTFGFLNESKTQRNNIVIIYKEPKNTLISNLLKKMRSYVGATMLHLDRKGLLWLTKQMKEKPLRIIMLVDQKVTSGMIVDFLGRKASASILLPTLAQKYNLPIVPIQVVRKNDYYFDIIYGKPMYMETSTNSDENIRKMTQQMQDIIGSWVLQSPDQWLWLHKRWEIHYSVTRTDKVKDG